MARPKPWIGQIEQIQHKLGDMHPSQPLGRRDIELIFGISRSAATELMGLMERETQYYGALIVTASAVLTYLRFCPEGQQADIEKRRKEKLAHTLAKAAADQSLRNTVIAVTSVDQWARLRELPVRFEPGKMIVEYSDAVGLLEALMKFCYACQGPDWDEFIRLTESQQLVMGGKE